MFIVEVADEPAIPHGEDRQHGDVLRLGAAQHGALHALVAVTHEIGLSSEYSTLLKRRRILNRNALLTNGSGILQVQELALADSFWKASEREWGKSGDKENL